METIKVNDILVWRGGYNCTFVEFYKVIEVKNGYVKFYEIENKLTEFNPKSCIGKKTAVDVPQKSTDKVLRRKIKTSTSSSIHYEYVKIDDYSSCTIWDGEPTYYCPID